MPYETDFDTAFTILLGKAQGTGVVAGPVAPPSSTPVAQSSSYTVPFLFLGGGSALSTSTQDPLTVEVPDPGEIVWVHMYAGNPTAQPVAVTATVDLQVTRWETFGGSTPVYGSGTPPRLQSDSVSSANLAGWFTHFDSGATLIARLTAFSGSATWILLLVRVRRDYTPPTQLAVVDELGNAVLDSSGNPIIMTG